MTTQHSMIASAVVAALKAAPAVAGGHVFRGRARPIGVGQPAGAVVRLARSASTESDVMGGRTTWKTLIAVECYGRGTAEVPDAGADAVVEAVFDRLATVPTLGGLAMDVAPFEGSTLEWDSDDMDTSQAAITAHFVITHQTTERVLK